VLFRSGQSGQVAVTGNVLDISLMVANLGGALAGTNTVSFYASTNSTITTSDTHLGNFSVSSLASGDSTLATLNVDLCNVSSLTDGAYYIGYIIDRFNAVAESDESDNNGFYSPPVTRACGGPNLISLNDNLSINGSQVTIDVTVQNSGNSTASSSRVGYYLSTDATITTSVFFLSNDFVGSLSPGGTSQETYTFDLCNFTSIPNGIYYVGYLIDYQGDVSETDEADNDHAFTTTVNKGCNLPNLTRQSDQLSQASSSITVDVTIINNGGSQSVISRVYYYASPDASITGSGNDVSLGWYDIVSALNAGSTSAESHNVDLCDLSGLSPGTNYYIGYVIDETNLVTESDENDNIFVFPQPISYTCTNGPLACGNAIPLSCGQPYNGTTLGGDYEVADYGCLSTRLTGPERVHTITTTQSGPLTATLDGVSFTDDLRVLILSACNPTSCLAEDDQEAQVAVAPAGTYYIVVDGNDGDSSSYTLTVGCAGTPTPGCANVINAYPYQTGFETTNLGGWQQVSYDYRDWTRDGFGTVSNNTGPGSAIEGNYYLYTEATNVLPGETFVLESPCFNFSNLTNPEIRFSHHMYGASMGSLALEASLDDGATWSAPLWSQAGDYGNQWNTSAVSLGAYAGQASVKLRFVGTCGTDFTSDMAIDDVRVVEVIPPPSISFIATDSTPCLGESVTFDNFTVNGNSYQWTFPGGTPSSSNLLNPIITYFSAGTYDVTVVATGPGGSDTLTKSAYIVVSGAPSVSLTLPFDTLCTSDGPQALSGGSPLGGTYSGPGVVSGQFDPSVAGIGIHTVSYTYVNPAGCLASDSQQVFVNSCVVQPVAAFVASTDTLIGMGGTVSFTNQSSYATSYEWLIDGSTYSVSNPGPVAFASSGLYDITLVAMNQYGSDTLTRSDYVVVHPFAQVATNQSGTLLGQAEIQYQPGETPDIIAAFDPNGNCAGWASLVINAGISYINLPIYGDDPNTTSIDEGITGSEAFELRLWDASENEILWNESPGNILAHTGWVNNNGAPMPGYNNPSDVYQFLRVSMDIIHLKPGWNLISTDVVPSDSTPASVLAGLAPGNLKYATGFQSNGVLPQAVFYDPDGPSFLNTLNELIRGYGYWVQVDNADTLVIYGDALASGYKRDLDAGWNLFGYLPQTPDSPAVFFSSLLSNSNLTYVTGFDQGTQLFDPTLPPFLQTLHELRNGYGYWLRVNSPVGGTQYRVSEGAHPQLGTPTFDFVNGRSDLPQGTKVLVYDSRGEVVVALPVLTDGYLATTPLYGDDPSTQLHEGLFVGDTLRF